MENNMQTFERNAVTLPPEDYAFLSGMMTALTAMYCRLHPVTVPAEPTPGTKKEETHNADQ